MIAPRVKKGVPLSGPRSKWPAMASFETEAMYGLESPSGTKLPKWAGKMGLPASMSRNGHQKVPISELSVG